MPSLPLIHPAIVHFPIALIFLSAAADALGWWTGRASLRSTGFWSMQAAAVSAAAAVAAGHYDMERSALSQEVHDYVHLHMRAGWVLLGALLLLALWRLSMRAGWQHPSHRIYPVAAGLVIALTVFQGWYGGEMVYAHGASVAAAGQGTEPIDQAQARLERIHNLLAAERGAEPHGIAPQSGSSSPPPSSSEPPVDTATPHQH